MEPVDFIRITHVADPICARTRPTCALSSKWHNRVCLVVELLLWSFHLGGWGLRCACILPVSLLHWRLGAEEVEVSLKVSLQDGEREMKNEEDLG